MKRKSGRKSAGKKKDVRHVPLDIADARAAAAKIVEKIERQIGGASGPAPEGQGKIVLEPLPRKEEGTAGQPQWTADVGPAANENPLDEKRVGAAAAGMSGIGMKVAGTGGTGIAPMDREGMFQKSVLFGIAGAGVASGLLYLANFEFWMVLGWFALWLIVMTAVSYAYINYSSR